MTCQNTIHILAVFLLGAWLCWFPWAFAERPAPKLARLAAAVLAVGAVGAAFILPTVCRVR